MGNAGFARRLVGAADLVPHHVADDRRPVVGNDDHLHAVVEHEIRRLAVLPCDGDRSRPRAAQLGRNGRPAKPVSAGLAW